MVLVLRTGMGLARTYSPATVAALLHIGTREVAGLERRALRQLRLSARTHTCGAAGQTLTASGGFGALGPWEAGLVGGQASAFGGERGALGQVKDLHYVTQSPPERSGPASKHPYPDGNALLGVGMPPGSVGTWLMAGMIVVGVVLAGFLFAGDRWRSRWLPRRPR
jgi:hypothetical protein